MNNFVIMLLQSNDSRTSISGGVRDGEHSDTSPFLGYTCAKRQNILEYFCHLTLRTTKTVYLMALYHEYHNRKYN